MRELLYDAARHFKRGKALADRGDVRGAMAAYEDALRELHAVKPQRMRDVLLAQVYLSRFQAGRSIDARRADSDLRVGYSYARTTHEPTVRLLAEQLWHARLEEHASAPPPQPRAGDPERQGGRRGRRRRGSSRNRQSG
ncbi:MAG: hypothetical protein WDA03_04500 [Trueperaceae bacterium]